MVKEKRYERVVENENGNFNLIFVLVSFFHLIVMIYIVAVLPTHILEMYFEDWIIGMIGAFTFFITLLGCFALSQFLEDRKVYWREIK